MDEHEGNSSLISLISKFNRSHFEQLNEGIPPLVINQLNKIMINSIFALIRDIRNVPTFGELYSLILKRVDLFSLLPTNDDHDDDDPRNEICRCVTALEELSDHGNETNKVKTILSCLYTLLTKQKPPKDTPFHQTVNSNKRNNKHIGAPSLFDFQNLKMLYSNTNRFNEINWKFVRSNDDSITNSFEPRKSISYSLPTNNSCRNSLSNDINWDLFTRIFNCHDVHPSAGLYLNSGRFNDINWDLLKVKPNTESHRKSLNAVTKMVPFGQRHYESFNDVFKYKLWNYETRRPVEPLLEDEGFSTPGSNFSEELNKHSENSDGEMHSSTNNSKIDGQMHSIREQRGCQSTHRESKFVSEHYKSILHLWKVCNVTRPMSQPVPMELRVSFEEFKTDINHLMFGMASNSFYFAPTRKAFHIREKLHLPSVTPEMLASFCTIFLECGNNFVVLGNFTATKSKIRECGPIHQTFCSCVKNVLQMHRYGLLGTRWERVHILLQLEVFSSPFRRKLSFTKDLCAMYVDIENHENKLPHGVILLDRLYASLVRIETTDLKFLALYFFESCYNIYLKIVSEWLFNGCFSNPANYDEFFVQIQHELEVCWDWRRLSYIRVNEERIPQCLKKFFKDIFACGKSVNLLRIFSKKDIFEQILPKTYPRIRCCFNSVQTEAYALEWKRFRDNFYKKRNWNVRLKDRLIQDNSADFQNVVKETRRKWFEDFETRLQRKDRFSTNISETLQNNIEESPKISSSNLDGKTKVVELDSCVPTDRSIIEERNDSVEQASFHAVTEFGDGLIDKTLSSGCSNLYGSESESTHTVIIPSSVYEGAGDSVTPFRCTSHSSTGQTEFQRNRKNSMSSDPFSQSSTISYSQVNKKFTSTPLSVCAQNRFKNMSTTFNNDPIESNRDAVTPMTECARNRMNVMRSEYCERLSNSNPVPSQKITDRKPFVESECGKNRSKIMSSEYHIRLNALAIQEIAISTKLSNENSARKSTKRETFTQEISLEELTQSSTANNENNSLESTVDNAVNLENTIVDVIREDVNLKNDYVHDGTISPVSEDREMENLVTVIENVEETNSPEESIPLVQSMVHKIPFNSSRYRKYPNIFPNFVKKSTSRLLSPAHSVKDVDIASVLYYLSPSISIPLRIQSKLVNEAILWVFIEQEGYLEHLKTLKNYVLLRKAEFSLSITNSLFEMSEDMKNPSSLLNSYTLNSILQRALSACNSKSLAKFERNLSFVLEDPIPDFFNVTDIQMLRCLSMHYTVKWPVNVLITEPIVKKYSRIFRFLIQLHRVSWVLKTAYKDMKNLKRGKSVQFTQIQLFRHIMTRVIRLLMEYITREALEQCWNDLTHNLMDIKINLDELYMIHLKYINKIIQRCFLCEESVMCHKAILHIFGSVLKYHDALQKGSWRRNEEFNLLYHTNFQNLKAAYQEFEKNLDNFRAVLRTLVYRKQRMYFEPLFLQLNNDIKSGIEL